jgi:hypothetical protein
LIRAERRELAWAPHYVGNDLAGTRQAPPTNTTPPPSAKPKPTPPRPAAITAHDRLARETADALAQTFDAHAGRLREIDDARARFRARPPRPGSAPNAPKPGSPSPTKANFATGSSVCIGAAHPTPAAERTPSHRRPGLRTVGGR